MSLLTAYGRTNGYIIMQMDRFAKMKKTIKDTLDSYVAYKFWNMVDATNDETYENIVKGSQITQVDNKINEARIGHLSSDWFVLHSSYFSQGLGIGSSLSNFLSSLGIRVHEDFANVFFESTGNRLSAVHVWADPDKEANKLYDYSSGLVKSFSTLPSTLGDTRLVLSGGGVITTITLGCTNGNLTTLTTTLLPPTDSSELVGESEVASISVVDTLTRITLSTAARSACFKTNQYVMIQSDTDESLYEIVRLHATVSPDTGVLTLASGTSLKYSYGSGDKVFPLFNKVTAITGSVNVVVKPVDDRVVGWGSLD